VADSSGTVTLSSGSRRIQIVVRDTRCTGVLEARRGMWVMKPRRLVAVEVAAWSWLTCTDGDEVLGYGESLARSRHILLLPSSSQATQQNETDRQITYQVSQYYLQRYLQSHVVLVDEAGWSAYGPSRSWLLATSLPGTRKPSYHAFYGHSIPSSANYIRIS